MLSSSPGKTGMVVLLHGLCLMPAALLSNTNTYGTPFPIVIGSDVIA
jgi:hypothetical protein